MTATFKYDVKRQSWVFKDQFNEEVLVAGQSNWNIGSSSYPRKYTAGTPALNMYFTNAETSGSTSAEPFYVKSTLTGAGQVGGRARFHCYTNVASGGWINALKSYMEIGSSGRTTGLASSMCVEMLMPNVTMASGGYYPLEIEYVAGGTSTNTVGALTGVQAGFIYLANSGDADGDFDDNGYFMRVDGLTAGANHLLSLTSETLRVAISTTATRYLVLSQAQDGLALGNSTTAQSYTAATPPLNFYFTAAGSGTTSAEPFYLKSTVTGTAPVGGRARFHGYCNVTAGAWLNALKGYMEFGASGKVTGLASAICAEIYMPPAALPSGSYCAMECEVYVPENNTTSSYCSFIYMNVDGHSTAKTSFCTNGYLLHLGTGIADTASGLFDTFSELTPKATASLRILIGVTPYYIPIHTEADFAA